ncbi:MAG: hypothetical protein K6L73_14945 [Cellvibrionaceae bacterium]
MNSAIQKLKEWQDELQRKADFDSIEAKANHIGLINEIDLAIKRIEICEKWEIFPKSIIKELPSTEVTEYRIMDDGESDNIQYWHEVKFEDGKSISLSGGDLVVIK